MYYYLFYYYFDCVMAAADDIALKNAPHSPIVAPCGHGLALCREVSRRVRKVAGVSMLAVPVLAGVLTVVEAAQLRVHHVLVLRHG